MSSVDIIASNDDIIMEILLRLPAKSLVKFRTVSRRWLRLICDPNFMVRHRPRHAKSVSGFIVDRVPHFDLKLRYMRLSLDETENSTQTPLILNLSFDPDAPDSTKIKQSSNGLLLCYRGTKTSPRPYRHYIFNPTTHSFSILPDPEPVFGQRSIAYFRLAYEPTVSSVYKVVCVRFFNRSIYQVQIYSSETGKWRNFRNQDSVSFSLISSRFRHGVFWNGGIHGINKVDGSSCRLDIETLQAMPMPPLPEGWNSRKFRHFLESQGHLFFISFHSPEYIIYEMEKGCSKWFVKHRLDVNLIVTAFSDIKTTDPVELERLISLVTLVELEDEGPSLVMYIPGRFISYGFKINSFKTLHEVKFYGSKCKFNWYCTYSYMETMSYV